MLRANPTGPRLAAPGNGGATPYDWDMVPAGVRSAGYRSLVRRGRNRLRIEAQDAWDRFVASDPGLARLFKGLRAVVAVGTTIVVQLLVAAALGVGGQTRVLHLMLGALIAMNMSTLVRPGRRRALARVDGRTRCGRSYPITPSLRPTLTNAATARSICSGECAALICVRMRAWPCGTTG